MLRLSRAFGSSGLGARSTISSLRNALGKPFGPLSFDTLRAFSTDENISSFCDNAFKIFGKENSLTPLGDYLETFYLNKDNKIQPEEIKEAYKHNSAGSEMTRLVEKYDLGGKKGVTWKSLDLLDLNVAVRESKVDLDANGDIPREAFDAWLQSALDEFKKLEDSLEGSQPEHE
eukprot:1373470-Amorphochlora_amoeboformis.AAC.1